MPLPHIRTELPGPKARALMARDRAVSSPSYPRDYPFVMARGGGVEVWDVDGNRFLDFAAGIAVCSTGHAHPAVVQAIKSATDDFLHISSDYWHERMTRLAERINELDPMRQAVQVFMCQSGTESVEGALKLARYVTCRLRKWRRSWSSPSRAKAGTWCRRTGSSRGCGRYAIATGSS